jgi:tetratricopeptide (TPR) repeat protein
MRVSRILLLAVGALGSAFAGQEARALRAREVPGNRELRREVPPKAAAEFRKSQEAFSENRIDKAVKHLRNGIALDPGNTDAYNDLGVIYFNTNEPAKALEAFSAMIEIDPDCFRAYVNMAFLLNQQQRYAEAERVARRAVDLRKLDSKARYLLGMALASQRKNLQEAEENLGAAATEVAEARLELSRLLMEKGELDRAMKELQIFTQQSKLAESQLLAK